MYSTRQHGLNGVGRSHDRSSPGRNPDETRTKPGRRRGRVTDSNAPDGSGRGAAAAAAAGGLTSSCSAPGLSPVGACSVFEPIRGESEVWSDTLVLAMAWEIDTAPRSNDDFVVRIILPKGAGGAFISGFVPYPHTLIPN